MLVIDSILAVDGKLFIRIYREIEVSNVCTIKSYVRLSNTTGSLRHERCVNCTCCMMLVKTMVQYYKCIIQHKVWPSLNTHISITFQYIMKIYRSKVDIHCMSLPQVFPFAFAFTKTVSSFSIICTLPWIRLRLSTRMNCKGTHQ